MLVVVGINCGVAMIGILAAVALPAYHVYTQRAKVSELVVNSVAIAHEFGEEYSQTDAMPTDIAQMPSHPDLPRFALRGCSTARSALSRSESNLMPHSADSSIYHMPRLDENTVINWKCKASPTHATARAEVLQRSVAAPREGRLR